MKIVATTDYKYIGEDVVLTLGSTIKLDDFDFYIQYIRTAANGNIYAGNFNYQIECEGQ